VNYSYVLPSRPDLAFHSENSRSFGMAVAGQPSFDVNQLVARFPSEETLLTKLVETDDGFRMMCEDLLLAATTLNNLEELQKAQELPRIAEYRQLVRELSSEVTKALERARHLA
jgi:hypothetical protein